MFPIVIAPKTEGKGRSFGVQMLAYVTADTLWPGGDGKTRRPVWAVVGSSEQALRPFMANWHRGRPAQSGHHSSVEDRYELLKSAGYQYTTQRHAEGALATVYLPELVHADPGMVDPKVVKFVMLPSRAWAAEQDIPDRDAMVRYGRSLGKKGAPAKPEDELAALAPYAYLFAVYLDRRTRCPLVADGRFYLQLMLAFEREEMAARPGQSVGGTYRTGFRADGLDDVGIASEAARIVLASQESVEDLIAREVAVFFHRTQQKGES